MMWEHTTTLTQQKTLESTIKVIESDGWEVCGVMAGPNGLVKIIQKRPRLAPRSSKGNDQAFLDLLEHHRQHHLRDEAQDIQPHHDQEYLGALICSIKPFAELEDLQNIRSRAEKELERIGPGGAVWQALRYVLGINGT